MRYFKCYCLYLSPTDHAFFPFLFYDCARLRWVVFYASAETREQIVDLWPRKVARFAEDGEAGVLPLEGRPDAVGPLTPPKGEGSESETIAGACKAYSLIARALAELRPFVPSPPDDPEAAPTASDQSPVHYVKERREGVESDAEGTAANGDSGRAMSLDDSNEDRDEEGEEGEQEGYVGGKRPATTRAVSARMGGRKSTQATGKRRAGRKRRRVNMSSYERRSSLRGDRRAEEEEEEIDEEDEEGDAAGGGGSRAEEQGDMTRGKRGEALDVEEEREETRGDSDGIRVGAGEMTVAAVRASLLRNRSDEGPSVEGEEWEDTVRKFIKHVESLPPGTTQEELSLMFAAALDPTLVRMRAANTSLISLAEACASRELGMPDEDGDDDDDDNYGGSGSGRNRSGRDAAVSRGGRGRGRFKVRLELDATEGDEPPPEGIAGLLRAVAGARAAVEATARAEACVAAAGDTLGGLQELKADYKRSLPTGPREPIQLIIAEEQARVSGYSSAYDIIVRQRVEDLRAAGAKVGEAYRAVEIESGWMSVKSQVDRFLRKFIEYCGFRLPNVGSIPDLLGLTRGAHQQWK